MNDQNKQDPNTGYATGSVPPTPAEDTPYQPNQVSSSTIATEQQPLTKSVSSQVSTESFQESESTNPIPSPFTESESYQEPPQVNTGAVPSVNSNPVSEINTNMITTNQPSRGISKFRIFIIVAVLAIAAIYAVVTFLYLQNKKLKENVAQQATESETLIVEDETPLPTVEVPVVANSDTVKILNGNIVLQASATSESKILVDKTNYSSTGITGFARVLVSPNNKKLCFESWPPAPEPALYIANSDGTDVIEISPNRQNCLWASDNLSIFYTDYLSKTSAKNIYQYVIPEEEENNMTLASQTAAKNRQYDIVGLSADGGKLICKFTEPKDITGNCEVNLTTLEVVVTE